MLTDDRRRCPSPAAKAAATHYWRDTEMNVTDPICGMSVVSTGEAQIRPDHVASTWRPTAL